MTNKSVRDQDPFEPIHELCRAKLFEEALNRLQDRSTSAIRAPFDQDLNHAWYVVGDIHFKTDAFDLALNAFEKALSFRNEDTQALHAIADCHAALGDLDTARNTLEAAITIDGTNPALFYDLGNTLFDLRKYDAALMMYAGVLQHANRADAELIRSTKRNIKLTKKHLQKGAVRKSRPGNKTT